MAKGISFDVASGKRIARSVRATEGVRRDLTGDHRAKGQILSTAGEVKWGKLDGTLVTTGTQTVSVWSDDWSAPTGDTIEDVTAPPYNTATIASGAWVRIRRRPDGVWYVDMAPC